MPHILVASDFSDLAAKAVHYACCLAGEYRMPVTVLHSFIIPVAFSDTPMPVIPVDEGREIAEERMQELQQTLAQTYPELEIRGKIMFGDITDCLEEYTEEAKPWITVVGNSGTDDAMLWLGSNVLSILRHAQSTVVAIPPDASYKKPEKICFACDFKNIADHLQTEQLVHLVQTTGAHLHVLNVDYHNANFDADRTLQSTKLHTALASLNPVYHFVEKENVEDGIQEFIEANRMDWLVIVPHKHSFFESLFHKSHTKALMKETHIPLVVMHEK